MRRDDGAPSRLSALRPVPWPAGCGRSRLSRPPSSNIPGAGRMQGELAEQVALVTGASRGIGRAIAMRLAGAGACVYVNFLRDAVAGEETVRRIRAAGGTAELAQFDIADAEASASAIGGVIKTAGALHILVNNAGKIGRASCRERAQMSVDGAAGKRK